MRTSRLPYDVGVEVQCRLFKNFVSNKFHKINNREISEQRHNITFSVKVKNLQMKSFQFSTKLITDTL